MMKHTMLPGLWFMTCQEEQDHHNDYIRIDHLATHGLGAIKLIEQQPYGPLTNKATLGQNPLPSPEWNPVSDRNKQAMKDLYVGYEAPRFGMTQAFQIAMLLGVAGWTMGWRFGLTPAIDYVKQNW